jgi:hypothetical protein
VLVGVCHPIVTMLWRTGRRPAREDLPLHVHPSGASGRPTWEGTATQQAGRRSVTRAAARQSGSPPAHLHAAAYAPEPTVQNGTSKVSRRSCRGCVTCLRWLLGPDLVTSRLAGWQRLQERLGRLRGQQRRRGTQHAAVQVLRTRHELRPCGLAVVCWRSVTPPACERWSVYDFVHSREARNQQACRSSAG